MYIAKKVIVFTLGLATSSYAVQAAPIFTLSPLTYVVSSSETLSDISTGIGTANRTVVVTKSLPMQSPSMYTTTVTLAPTTTKAGIATTYEKFTVTTTHTSDSYFDSASYAVKNTTPSVTRDQQSIRLTGMVKAKVATKLTYQAVASGYYALIADGHNRFKPPPDVALWFHAGPTNAIFTEDATDTSLASTKVLTSDQYTQSSTPISINLMAGDSFYVAAEVDAETHTSITNFALNFTSSAVGGAVLPTTTNEVNRMAFTSAIAPIPEPGTDAMFLTGLGLMGVLIGRKKTPA